MKMFCPPTLFLFSAILALGEGGDKVINNNSNTKTALPQKKTSLGERLYNWMRVNHCANICKTTMPPWYSNLASCQPKRDTSIDPTQTPPECLKVPETVSDCRYRCEHIVKSLAPRQQLKCARYCEIMYPEGGQAKTLQYCNSKC